MKKISTILFLVLGFVSFSQSNLTMFNNGGQQFYAILNGVKQNSIPMTNVSVSGIKNGSYSVKLIFSDGKTADIDKNFYIEEPSDITTRVIFKKGKGKLQLIGMEPTKGAIQQEGVLVYRPDNSAVYSDAVVEQAVITQETITSTTTTMSNSNGNIQTNQSGNNQSNSTQTETINMSVGSSTNGQGVNQTVTVTDPNNPGATVGMNVNINVSETTNGNGSENVNMSINMSGTGVGTESNQTSQENTQFSQTTTVTTSGTQINSATNSTGSSINTNSNTAETATTKSTPIVNCKNILGDGDAFVEDVNSLTMDDDKKELILKDLNNYCLTASQAYKITEVLIFEEDRLTVAKFLYDRMIDKDNARTLMTLFTFDSSKLEYREYIRK